MPWHAVDSHKFQSGRWHCPGSQICGFLPPETSKYRHAPKPRRLLALTRIHCESCHNQSRSPTFWSIQVNALARTAVPPSASHTRLAISNLCNGTRSTAAVQDCPPGNTCRTDLPLSEREEQKHNSHKLYPSTATDYSGPTNHLVSQIFSFLGAIGPGAVRRGGKRTEQHLLAICGLSSTQHSVRFRAELGGKETQSALSTHKKWALGSLFGPMSHTNPLLLTSTCSPHYIFFQSGIHFILHQEIKN